MRKKTTLERFEDKVFYSPDGCWYWIGAIGTEGYGHFKAEGSFIDGAHRVSYKMFINPVIPAGYYICHSCDNRKCVNPNHLFLGTPTDNNRDMAAKNRCKPQHGENHFRAKLKESDVLEVRKLSASGMGNYAIARLFNVTGMCIMNIVRRETWRHVLDNPIENSEHNPEQNKIS